MQETAYKVREWLAEGRPVVVGRVVAIQGFSTWPGDELLAVEGAGDTSGGILGHPGTEQLHGIAVEFLASEESSRTVTIEIHGKAVIEAGLSCGGQATVLMQRAADLPPQLWDALCDRAPVALVTAADGARTVVVGTAAPSGPTAVDTAADDPIAIGRRTLASGHSVTRSVETADGPVLVEAWVPVPRLVVVGTGDAVAALAAQAGLLGWDTRAVEGPDGLEEVLGWAGATAALVVLSHDPHVDAPALHLGLVRGVSYVGAMGSRSTQSRRAQRLGEVGLSPETIDRIRRPVGLDLGGRSAPEVALAICAEVLAVRTGRDGRPLKDRSGPIHDRTGVAT